MNRSGATPLDRSQMPPVIITAMMMKDFASKNLRKKCSASSQAQMRDVIVCCLFMQGDPAGAGHSAVRSGRGTSGISSRLTTERISSSLAQSSGEKRAMMRSMTSDI